MGSRQPNGQVPLNNGRRREVTVLITGFGPFQEKYPVNPSFEITRSLPQELQTSATNGLKASLISYGTPIRVCYEDVRNMVPKILESYIDSVDLVLHIGMASGRNFYTLEQIAHRDGYHKNKDIDGKTLPADEGLLRFADCPANMTTSLNYMGVLHRWQSILRTLPGDSPGFGADCRPSNDAGSYLCDYTYFNSLAWYGRQSGSRVNGMISDRPVMFLHVPAESDEQALEKGRVVTMAAIEAMVEELSLSRANWTA